VPLRVVGLGLCFSLLTGCERGGAVVSPLISQPPPATVAALEGPGDAVAEAPAGPAAGVADPTTTTTATTAPPEESPPRAAEPLPLRVEATVTLQPARAKTSGNTTDGSVAGVAFFGPRSEMIVGGGNDDRVHLAELASGRELWVSSKLGKDVEAVAACGEHFAAITYHGRLAVYRKRAGGGVSTESIRHAGGSKWLAFTEDCQHLLTPDFLGPLFIYRREGGGLAAEVPSAGYRNFGYAGGRLTYRSDGADYTLATARYFVFRWADDPSRGAIEALPYAVEDDALGLLVQVLPTPWGGLAREHCDRERCRVVLEDRGVAVDFAVAGGVWTLALGSRLAISSGGEYLAWYRDGLPVQIVELASGRRAALPKIARTMSATVDFAFDPRDPQRLAVTMDPAPNKVTVYRLGDPLR
jgi:hypothetical protein